MKDPNRSKMLKLVAQAVAKASAGAIIRVEVSDDFEITRQSKDLVAVTTTIKITTFRG